jgi:hypothetical protein
LPPIKTDHHRPPGQQSLYRHQAPVYIWQGKFRRRLPNFQDFVYNPGVFKVKTQLELAAEGNELNFFAAAKLGEVEAFFRSYLENEFSKTVSRRRPASIMLHIFGMRVHGYQRGSADRMRQGLHEGLPWLPWE